jgi:hypothetical protein
MKLLYIAHDRRAAEVASAAIWPVAPGAAVEWAATLGDAWRWIEQNRDVAGLLAEVEPDNPSLPSFVSHVRRAGVTARVVMIVPKTASGALTSLETLADEIIRKSDSFIDDLKAAVGRVPPSALPRRRLRMLYVGDAALAKESLGGPGASIDVFEAVPGTIAVAGVLPADFRPGGAPPFDIALIEHGHPGADSLAILKDVATRMPGVPAVLVADWNEDLAVQALKLGAADYVVKSKASLRATLFRLKRLLSHAALVKAHSELEQKLAERGAAAARVEEQPAATRQEAQEFLRRESELNAALAREVAERRALEAKLTEAEASYHLADALRLAESTAAAGKMAQQQAEFTASIAQTARARDTFEQRMRDALAAVELARVADAAAKARQSQLETDLAAAAASRDSLQQQLGAATLALQRADAKHAAETKAAAERFIEQKTGYDARLAEAAAAQEALHARAVAAESALERAEQQHASEMSDASARLAESGDKARVQLAEAAAATKVLESRLAELTTALARVKSQAAGDRQAAVDEATRRNAQHEAELAKETAARRAIEHERDAAAQQASQRLAELEKRLADATLTRQMLEKQVADARAALAEARTAFEAARQMHADAMSDAAARFAESQDEANVRAAQATASTLALEIKLRDTAAALDSAQQQADADRQTAADERARFESQLAEDAAKRRALETTLAAEQQITAEQRAAAERAAHRQATLESELAQEAAQRQSLETTLAAERQITAEQRAAAEQAAHRQATLESELAQEAARRQSLETTLAAEQQITAEQRAAAEQAANRQATLESELAQAAAQRQSLETRLAGEQQIIAGQRAAAEQAAHRQATLETELRQEIARRETIEQEFAEARSAADSAERRFLEQIAAMRQRSREHEARIEDRAAQERAEWEGLQAQAQERIRQLQREADLARQALVTAQKDIQRLQSERDEARSDVERTRLAGESDMARHRAEYSALQQLLERTRTTGREALDRVAGDRDAERVRFEAMVAERDAQLREQMAHKVASDEAAAKALANLEQRLRMTIEAGQRDSATIGQLRDQLKALGDELEAMRQERETLKTEANRIPLFLKQIDDLRSEHRRQFEVIPVNICRCGREGSIIQASHALAGLLGYESPEELQQADFAGSVFESSDELQWLIDSCLASRSVESVETAWRKKDGGRVLVRLVAAAVTPDTIDLAVQDITPVRVLEERLRSSQRLEAVARYASEIAVTCDNLLGHVKHEGQQWLDRIDNDVARYHGQLLLDEVTRASGFLRQLAVYGKEQKNATDLVEIHRLLRDLEPVLKRVAGGSVDFALPKTTTPLHLDVEAERVERMLVNIAAYGRERMPFGGRLIVDVGSVVLDRAFIDKYPNVRPGAHVLLTINEVRRARPEFAPAPGHEPAAEAPPLAEDHPGVDLGALQALVSDCGGHLWMQVEPPGDMALKIHLPRRVLDRPAAPANSQAKRPASETRVVALRNSELADGMVPPRPRPSRADRRGIRPNS